MLCHSECIGKEWTLMEKESGYHRVPVPHLKPFSCLAIARKAMITYQKNPDFQHLKFGLQEGTDKGR